MCLKKYFLILISLSLQLVAAELAKNVLGNNEKHTNQSIEMLEREIRNLKLENRYLLMKLEKLEQKLLLLNEELKNFTLSAEHQENKKNLAQLTTLLNQLNFKNKQPEQIFSNYLLQALKANFEHQQQKQAQADEIKNEQKLSNNYNEHFNCIGNCENVTNIPTTCLAALAVNRTGDGIYQIYAANSSLKPFYVYCLQDAYGDNAWMLIQRRQFGTTNFARNWSDYKKGFGDLNADYWIGLERLHALTSKRKYELWIQLKDNAGIGRYANYNEFVIANETEGYKISVLGDYEGDAGNSLIFNYDAKFSTYDRDNDDEQDSNCAEKRMAGWWFRDCKHSLNGIYNSTDYGTGINWIGWHDYRYSLKYIHIAIRPVSIDLMKKTPTVIKPDWNL